VIGFEECCGEARKRLRINDGDDNGCFYMRALRMCIPGEWLADIAQSHAEIIVLQNFPLQVMRLRLSNQFPNWIQIVETFQHPQLAQSACPSKASRSPFHTSLINPLQSLPLHQALYIALVHDFKPVPIPIPLAQKYTERATRHHMYTITRLNPYICAPQQPPIFRINKRPLRDNFHIEESLLDSFSITS
jgi:hypothetical protein